MWIRIDIFVSKLYLNKTQLNVKLKCSRQKKVEFKVDLNKNERRLKVDPEF